PLDRNGGVTSATHARTCCVRRSAGETIERADRSGGNRNEWNSYDDDRTQKQDRKKFPCRKKATEIWSAVIHFEASPALSWSFISQREGGSLTHRQDNQQSMIQVAA